MEHVHEAARAVIALFCRLDFEGVRAVYDSRAARGEAVVGLRPATKLVLLARPAAESHFTGTVMSDGDNDKVRSLLRAFHPGIGQPGIEGLVQICKKEALQLVRSIAAPIKAVAAELDCAGALSRDEVEAIVASRISERVCG